MFDRYFFFPNQVVSQSPADYGIAFEDVYFRSQDGIELNGWFVPGGTDLTWLWFHGNGGSLGDRAEDLTLYNSLGVNIFVFDYRGYGHSAGKPTEKGVYRDATGALQYLQSRQDVANSRIVYFGQSLGGAIALELATRHPPLGLVLESTFSSAADMARQVAPRLPLHVLVRRKFDSTARIRKVSSPVLVVHGNDDSVVPLAPGRKLYEAAIGPKRWMGVPNADHSDVALTGGTLYLETLGDFLASLARHPS